MAEEEEDHGLGLPISYLVLERGTPVYAEGGVAVGVVKRVLYVPEKDIFDGITVHTHHGDRFAYADQIGAIHEHAVGLRISQQEFAELLPPTANPAVMKDDPAEGPPHRLDGMRDLSHRAWNRLSGKY
jgi:hypothetical protein